MLIRYDLNIMRSDSKFSMINHSSTAYNVFEFGYFRNFQRKIKSYLKEKRNSSSYFYFYFCDKEKKKNRLLSEKIYLGGPELSEELRVKKNN